MMKKLLSYLLLGATAMSLSACALFTRTVTIIDPDGNETPIEFKNEFTYEAPEKDGYIFMGCFAENDLESKQYVSYDGKSVQWNSTFPNTIYAVYSQKKSVYTFEQSYDDISLTAPGRASTISYAMPDVYAKSLANENYVGLINIQLEHFEKEEGVAGLNTFDWSEYYLKVGEDTLESGVFHHTDTTNPYYPFNRMFQLTKEQAFSKIDFQIKRPDSCASTASAKYRNIKVVFYVGEAAQIKAAERNNLKFANDGSFYEVFDDGSSTLNNSYAANMALTHNLAFNVKNWLTESNFTNGVSVTFFIDNYGRKFILANWIDCRIKIKNREGSVLAEKETFVLESNSTTTTKNVSINVSAAQLASMHSFVIEFVYPTGNQSTFFYYINNVSYQISPRN